MKNKAVAFFSWVAALWTAKVFLVSLPYKFSNHPDTQHIFGTIGEWMKGSLGPGIGEWFIQHGAAVVGVAELAVSTLILLPALLFVAGKVVRIPPLLSRRNLHGIGGLVSAGIMAGAAFFHLATPLGIEVLHQGKHDGGSLFYAAVSILVLGLLSAWANFTLINSKNA